MNQLHLYILKIRTCGIYMDNNDTISNQ